MDNQKDLVKYQLEQWTNDMTALELPDWKELPNLELYMDQVVLLLTRYLSPLAKGEDEKFITASIVNNYVRLKIMPPPVKKKYARRHLACLIMICVLKQSLSISCIQRLLPADWDEETVRQAYTTFVSQMSRVSGSLIQQVNSTENLLLNSEDCNPAISSAIAAYLAKSLTEYLLQPLPNSFNT